jgi:hypothetical protein
LDPFFPKDIIIRGFAIKVNVAINFLENYGINVRTGANTRRKLDFTKIAKRAKSFTVSIDCSRSDATEIPDVSTERTAHTYA